MEVNRTAKTLSPALQGLTRYTPSGAWPSPSAGMDHLGGADTGPSLSGKYSHWKRIARLLVFGGVVVLIATQLKTRDLGHAFAHLGAGYLVAVVLVLSPLAVLLRALRWRCLLPLGDRVPLRSYVGAYLVGMLANSILLGRFGELVKARFICRPGLDYGRSLSVVLIDRLLEGLALLMVFAVVLLNTTLPIWASRLAWVAGFASLAALVLLRTLFAFRAGFLQVTERGLAHLPAPVRSRVLRAAERLLAGCEALASYRRVMMALLYAFAVWGVEIGTVVLLFKGLSIRAPWLVAAIVLLVVLSFGMLVPISPGSVGVYQLLCALSLSLWGVDRQLGLTLGIVML
jgi:uncharacterized protein (TIRG00374 family)